MVKSSYLRLALITASICVFLLGVGSAYSQESGTVDLSIGVAVCGNSTIEGDEECDGAELNGASCSSQGFTSGTLSCDIACEYDTSGCTNPTATPSSSSGSSSGSVGAPVCSDTSPSFAPWLFAANRVNSTSIQLYFTAAGSPVGYYALEYGTSPGNYQYAASNIGGSGTSSYIVTALAPDKTYYFRVRGGNGCATGPWSNEIVAATGSLIETGELVITPDFSVPPSDAGVPGQEDLPGEEPGEIVQLPGYTVNIEVKDTEEKPVEGALVQIHSEVQEEYTDVNGVATFEDVPPGNHRVVIAYNGFQGEQWLNLAGDVVEFNLKITVEETTVVFSPQAIAIIGILAAVILLLVVLLLRARRK